MMDSPRLRLHFVIAAALLLTARTVSNATNLMPCPDCEGMISRRADMCPHCGCPADAIKEAAEQFDKANLPPPLFPVARYVTTGGTGFAAAVADGESTFLILDARALGDPTGLSFNTLDQAASPIRYQSVEVTDEAPLARFKTSETNLFFMLHVEPSAPDQHWLLTNGSLSPAGDSDQPPGDMIARTDANTNIIAFIVRNDEHGQGFVLGSLTWREVSPAQLRTRINQLQAPY